VIVFDADTGAYKRHWGAYGNKPDDIKVPDYDPAAPPSKHFNTVHCANVSKDGFVYVCDRVNNRVQVFRKDGTFVREAFFEKNTLRSGSVWDMTFSRDPQQTYIYMANGVNEKINIVLRSTLEILTAFGDGGRQPGQFFGVHNLTPTRRATCMRPRPTRRAGAALHQEASGRVTQGRPGCRPGHAKRSTCRNRS
jgi:hypothetical protein